MTLHGKKPFWGTARRVVSLSYPPENVIWELSATGASQVRSSRRSTLPARVGLKRRERRFPERLDAATGCRLSAATSAAALVAKRCLNRTASLRSIGRDRISLLVSLLVALVTSFFSSRTRFFTSFFSSFLGCVSLGALISLVFRGFSPLLGVWRDWRDSGAIQSWLVPHRNRTRPPVAKQRRSRGATETFAVRPEAARVKRRERRFPETAARREWRRWGMVNHWGQIPFRTMILPTRRVRAPYTEVSFSLHGGFDFPTRRV